MWEAVEKMPPLPLPSTAATIDNATISAVGSIPPLPPSTKTTIPTINDRHHRCHTVDNDARQKPVVVVHCQRRQRRSSLTEATVNGSHGNGSLCEWQSLLTEVEVGWRDDDAMTLAAMVSLADGDGWWR